MSMANHPYKAKEGCLHKTILFQAIALITKNRDGDYNENLSSTQYYFLIFNHSLHNFVA